MNSKPPILAIFLLAVSISSIGQNYLSSKKIQLLDSIAVQDVPEGAPGIVTAIVQDGIVIYKNIAGYADLSDSTLITENTRFNIASNGKQFTALAILDLIETKKIKLSDDIRLFFPSLYPNIREKITLQSLLNHTSGIRDCYDLWSLQGYTWWQYSFSNYDVLKLIDRQSDLNFKPGTAYLYSNTNYILLALIVEKVSGKSFVEFTNMMFKKLNMPNTAFACDHTKIAGPIAKAYFNFGSWTTYEWLWNVCGDGNLFSTLLDQIKWETVIQGKMSTELNQKIIQQSQLPIAGAAYKKYGFGLEFATYKKIKYRFHEGATGAWKATTIRFPSKKTAIITLTNTGKSIPAMQTRQMADILFDLKTNKEYILTKPLKTGKYISEEEIPGTYLSPTDFSFIFEKKNNKIYLKRIGRSDVELEREADNIFHQKYDTLFKQEFTKDTKGNLQVTAYYIDHSPYTLSKQSSNLPAFNAKLLNGTFINAETETELQLTHEAGNQFTIKMGSKKSTSYIGLLVSSNKILAGNYSIAFQSSGITIDSLYLNGDRIKKVKFKRKD